MEADKKNNPSTAQTKEQVEGWRKGKDESFSPILYQKNYDLSSPLNDSIGIDDQKCVVCGKNFIKYRGREYAYGDCCSYTCYMHRDDNKTIPHAKPVEQYTRDGTYLMTFNSAVEAAEYVGLKKAESIRDCCNGKTESSAGFLWRWKEVENA